MVTIEKWDTQEPALATHERPFDPATLTILLHRARPRLVRWIAAKIPRGSRVDPEDVVQEALVAAFRSIEQLRSGDLDAWLETIVRNRLRDALRSGSRKKRGGDQHIRSLDEGTVAGLLEAIAMPTRSPGTRVVRAEAIQVMMAGLNALPEDQRRAVWLIHGEGLPISVAAAAMGKTEPAFRGLCCRGLESLRATIRDSGVLTRGA